MLLVSIFSLYLCNGKLCFVLYYCLVAEHAGVYLACLVICLFLLSALLSAFLDCLEPSIADLDYSPILSVCICSFCQVLLCPLTSALKLFVPCLVVALPRMPFLLTRLTSHRILAHIRISCGSPPQTLVLPTYLCRQCIIGRRSQNLFAQYQSSKKRSLRL